MMPSSVKVQISPESVPSTPSWFGEVTLIAHVFKQRGLLSAIVERVQFARARFGTYDTIDFVVVLLGYAISRERTLEDFYERLQPFGLVFMGLFERADLPSRYALSRYLAALDKPCVEALRTLFQEDLGACHALGLGGLYESRGQALGGRRCGCNQRGRTATRLASWSRFALCPSSDGCGMCTGLSRA